MNKTSRFPYANTQLVAFIAERLRFFGNRKSVEQIAAECGFARAEFWEMIQSGASRLPLDRVPQVAKTLECNAAELFMLALEQSDSALAATVREIFGVQSRRCKTTAPQRS